MGFTHNLNRALAGLCLGMTPVAAGAEPAQQQPVANATQTPYDAICHLFVVRSKPIDRDRQFNGTAFLYRGRYLLTAAHNVYSPWYNKIRSIGISCGVTNADIRAPQQVVGVGNVRWSRQYSWTLRRHTDFPDDFAVIRLDQPLRVAGFGLAETENLPDATAVSIAGFPGLSGDENGMTGQRMFAGHGRMRHDGVFVSYDIATAKGNSGGPVWIDTADGPKAVGIHVKTSGARALNKVAREEIEAMILSLEGKGQP